MKRNKFNLNHYHLSTTEMGTLKPVGLLEVLPGDTIQHSVSALCRLSPLNTPVMHPVNIRIHHFFVPNRLVWDEWEEFITGGEDGMSEAEIPTQPGTEDKRTVSHSMGVAPNAGLGMSQLPIRAFNLIYNEYYRDQDMVAKRDEQDNTLPQIAWEKDYFTTSRPFTQKGPAITIPVSGFAAVEGIGKQTNSFFVMFVGLLRS